MALEKQNTANTSYETESEHTHAGDDRKLARVCTVPPIPLSTQQDSWQPVEDIANIKYHHTTGFTCKKIQFILY